jgi:hypothetical protein
MQNQSHSLFFLPPGCRHTQVDGESIYIDNKIFTPLLRTKSISMQILAPINLNLVVYYRDILRRKRRLQYTILKATEFQFWLAIFFVNKFRSHLFKVTIVPSLIFQRSLISRGYYIFLKVLTKLDAYRQEQARTHKFLFGFTTRRKLNHARMCGPVTTIISNI